MKLAPGADAPPLDLPSTAGRDVSLAGLRGRKLVLSLYSRE